MLTKDEALTATEFHYGRCQKIVGARGGVRIRQEKWRRNGATKTWVTRPTEFAVPLKFGLYQYGTLTDRDADQWHVADACPLLAEVA